jgi:hypothetical protein
VEYTFPKNKIGFKYSIIVHPGADPTQIKFRYDGDYKINFNDSNDLLADVHEFGVFKESAPIGFYKEDKQEVNVRYKLDSADKTLISFSLPNSYNKHKTLIIDPWVSNPNFTDINNAYDIDYDNAGNVFVYGGHNPFKLTAFDASGVQQWTYLTPASGTPWNQMWYGDFVVDKLTGDCFIAEGVDAACNVRGVQYVKVNTAGTQTGTYSFTQTGLCNNAITEIWRMSYVYCTQQMIIGGGGTEKTVQTAMLDKTMTSSTPVNSLAAAEAFHDVCLMAADPAGGKVYMAMAANSPPTGPQNVIMCLPIPALSPATFIVADGYNFSELGSIKYVNRGVGGGTNAMNGMAVSPNWLYLFDGATLKQFNKSTGVLNAGTNNNLAAIPYQSGGLDVDACDNVYSGLGTSIFIYNLTLGSSSTIALGAGDTVYDIVLNPNGAMIYACGKGFVQAIAMPGTPCPPCSIILPIELIEFNATCKDNKVKLKWTTASEINAKSFTLERSYDGNNFSQVAEINATGTTSLPHSYRYEDEKNGQRVVYYRLKETDYNGASTVFNIISTLCHDNQNDEPSIYPVPATNILTVHTGNLSPAASLSIYDVLGKFCYGQVLELTSNGSDFKIDLLDKLLPGVFFVVIESETGKKVFKLVKQ